MRIVTWNCCRGKFADKAGFVRALSPDIAVIQECGRPPEDSPKVRWIGANPRQGVAVIAADGWSIEPIAVAAELQRWIVPFRVSGPIEFTLVATWVMPDRSSYSRAMCRGIDALAELISSGPAIVAGDFNANPVFDRKRRDWTYATIEARLHALGLASAYHTFHAEAPGEETRATYYHMWREDLAYHLDYCFIPNVWLPSVTNVRIGGYEEWKGRSDHRPVIVDLRLFEDVEDIPTIEGRRAVYGASLEGYLRRSTMND